MTNTKRRNGKRLVFYLQNEKRKTKKNSCIGKRRGNFDFQYLFIVCDFFGSGPEVIQSPHITRAHQWKVCQTC